MRLNTLTLSAKEIATSLGISVRHFRHRRRHLEAAGFPRSLPGFAARWSAAQVHAWIANGGVAGAPRAEHGDYIAESRGYLEAKYAGARA